MYNSSTCDVNIQGNIQSTVVLVVFVIVSFILSMFMGKEVHILVLRPQSLADIWMNLTVLLLLFR